MVISLFSDEQVQESRESRMRSGVKCNEAASTLASPALMPSIIALG